MRRRAWPGVSMSYDRFIAGGCKPRVQKPRSQVNDFAAPIFAAIGRELNAPAAGELAARQKANRLHPVASEIRFARAEPPAPGGIDRVEQHAAGADVLEADDRDCGLRIADCGLSQDSAQPVSNRRPRYSQ